MHKRVTFFAIPLLLLLPLLVLLFRWLSADPTAPTFLPAQTQPRIGPIDLLTYNSLAENPFPGGKVWLSICNPSSTNVHYYLFDIENRKILGELQNAVPLFVDPDRSRALCHQHRLSPGGVRFKLLQFLNRIRFGKFSVPAAQIDTEVFWLLDLKRNSVKLLGPLAEAPGPATFLPSPSYRYAVKRSGDSNPKTELSICNLQKGTLTHASVDGGPVTWWDDDSIVLKTDANDFLLYHIRTGNLRKFLSISTLNQFLAGSAEWAASPRSVFIFPAGTGKERQLYLSKSGDWPDGKSYLAKIQPPDATLQLVTNHFRPAGYPSRIDSTANWQLLSSSSSDFPTTRVRLRDLRTGETRTLVDGLVGAFPKPGTNSVTNFLSAMLTYVQTITPNFYNNTVIYLRSNMLWQIDFSCSNNTRLFPPP